MRSSMYFPMRSLMLAPGLNDSNFAYTGTASGESCTRTSGVSPIVSNTDDRGSRWVVMLPQSLPAPLCFPWLRRPPLVAVCGDYCRDSRRVVSEFVVGCRGSNKLMPLVRFRRGMSETDAQADVTVVLPDGAELDVPAGATVEDVAFGDRPWLGRDTVAGKIDGELVEKYATVHDGARIEIVTDQSDEYLTVLRHPPPTCSRRPSSGSIPKRRSRSAPDRRGVLLRRDRRRPRRGRPRRHRGGDGRSSSRPTTTLSARSGPVRRPKRSTPTTSTNCRYSTRKPTTRRSPSTCRTTGRTSVRAPTSSRRARSGRRPS